MKKRKPIKLDFEPATPEQVAKVLGVSKKRLAEIRELLKPKYGYHTVKIKKGVLGKISKIREEFEELQDAEKQKVKLLIGCELSDLYGAMEAYAETYGFTMVDISAMANLTGQAFRQGYRR